jgi:hypothetical protein
VDDALDIAAKLYREGKFGPAFERYLVVAQQGDVYSQAFVGWMYATGCGVTRNEAEALKWYSVAANNGSAMAQELLGFHLYSTKKYSDAISWYEKAGTQGNMTALWRLGRMYRDGKGVDSDKNRAYSLFEKASQKGHVFARRDLAVLRMQGHRGVGQVLSGVFLFVRAVTDLIRISWKSESDERIRH